MAKPVEVLRVWVVAGVIGPVEFFCSWVRRGFEGIVPRHVRGMWRAKLCANDWRLVLHYRADRVQGHKKPGIWFSRQRNGHQNGSFE